MYYIEEDGSARVVFSYDPATWDEEDPEEVMDTDFGDHEGVFTIGLEDLPGEQPDDGE
jgi:hypothetical protein